MTGCRISEEDARDPYFDGEDISNDSATNSVGNWRSHILVKCLACQRPMGYHTGSKVEICINCTLKGYGEKK